MKAKKYVWVIQSNEHEETDQIFIFSSKKKALSWLAYEDEGHYHLCRKEVF